MKKNTFIELLKKTNMFVYGLSKGTIIMTPKSTIIWELIKNNLDINFKKIGIKNVQMPSLIPLKYLKKEQINFEGFEPELITITEIGKKKLEGDERLILRPTSEVVFSYYFSKILKSYRDLPILFNQWSNVWRWENNTNPFFRTTEFFWNEGHTLHDTKKDAIFFCNKIFELYKSFITKKLLIPVITGRKSIMERFAGAENTWAIETLLPDGQFLQLSTVHYLGHGFVKMFDINFLNKENKLSLPHQTSWAISTRLIAGVLSTHSDEEGLIIPPFVVDNQIIIIPVKKNNDKDNLIEEYCINIKQKIEKEKYRVEFINKSNKSSSFLNKEYREQGIPLQIEIGLNEVNNKLITFQLRTNKNKQQKTLNEFFENLKNYFIDINNSLYKKAQKKLLNKYQQINTYKEYKNIKLKDKIYVMFFCGQIECETKIKQETNTTSRILETTETSKNCFRCNEPTKLKAIFGRSY